MNSFGTNFRISLFGESHGERIGVCVDGCPAGIALTVDDFTADLQRRRSGAKGTTPRLESDTPELVSGVYNGHTTGAPIAVLFKNENTRSGDYADFTAMPRPGHADFTAAKKFGAYNDPRGGGHFSGRITLALVAAGVIAKKILTPVNITAQLIEAGGSADIQATIDKALAENDSIGGVIECYATHLPVGWGEPFFNSVESLIAHLAFSIPAVKGIEFGSGFNAACMKGSEHNDTLINNTGQTATNNAGGINGGITNGNDLVFRLAVKPTSSIGKGQQTFNFEKDEVGELKVAGRHDACIALRVPVIAEAITAIALADLKLSFREI